MPAIGTEMPRDGREREVLEMVAESAAPLPGSLLSDYLPTSGPTTKRERDISKRSATLQIGHINGWTQSMNVMHRGAQIVVFESNSNGHT
jgi:hypothetical protein